MGFEGGYVLIGILSLFGLPAEFQTRPPDYFTCSAVIQEAKAHANKMKDDARRRKVTDLIREAESSKWKQEYWDCVDLAKKALGRTS